MKFDTNEFLLDEHRLSPVTFGNDHGNKFIVLNALAPLSVIHVKCSNLHCNN